MSRLYSLRLSEAPLAEIGPRLALIPLVLLTRGLCNRLLGVVLNLLIPLPWLDLRLLLGLELLLLLLVDLLGRLDLLLTRLELISV